MKRPGKSWSQRRKHDVNRQRIVDAARGHFFSHGFRSVTMDDLAVELGISKKTLYAYFPGKFDLLEAVLADKLTGVEATLKEVTRAHPDDCTRRQRRRGNVRIDRNSHPRRELGIRRRQRQADHPAGHESFIFASWQRHRGHASYLASDRWGVCGSVAEDRR